MFDPEKFIQWSRAVQKMYGQDFWASVFNSPQGARFLEQMANLAAPSSKFPRVDVYQTEKEIVVLVELPGVRRQDIQIQLADDRLLIKGVVQEPGQGFRLVSGERYKGNFERSVSLPELVGKTGYRASFRDGLLEIRLTRVFEASLRTIPIDGDE